jgi:hypothetical protein
MQVHGLPTEIKQRQERITRLDEDIARRNAHAGEEFAMEVNGRKFSGKGAREAAAAALTQCVLAGRDDPALNLRGKFRGFEILSRGRPGRTVFGSDEEALPELFIRGSGFYGAQLNPEHPVGTMQSIEHALRALDKSLEDESERLARAEKMLADYREQLGKPFEHETRLKELLTKQAALNAALDLDKGERQVAPDEVGDPEQRDEPPAEERPARWQAREMPRKRQIPYKTPTLRPGL